MKQQDAQDAFANKIIYDESGIFGWWRGAHSKDETDFIQEMYAGWKETPNAWKILEIIDVIRVDSFVQHIMRYAEHMAKNVAKHLSTDATYTALVTFFRKMPAAEACIVKGQYRSLTDSTMSTDEALARVWVDVSAVLCGLCEITEDQNLLLPPGITQLIDMLRDPCSNQQQDPTDASAGKMTASSRGRKLSGPPEGYETLQELILWSAREFSGYSWYSDGKHRLSDQWHRRILKTVPRRRYGVRMYFESKIARQALKNRVDQKANE